MKGRKANFNVKCNFISCADLRIGATYELAKLGGPGAIAALVEALKDEGFYV